MFFNNQASTQYTSVHFFIRLLITTHKPCKKFLM